MKSLFRRFIKKPVPKTGYVTKGGFKCKEDTIYCFITEDKKWGVMKLTESKSYEELIPPIYDSTGYEKNPDLIVAVKYFNGKYTLGGNTYYLFNTNGLQVATIENIEYLNFEENGNMLIRKNNRYGVLDEKFQIEIPCEYALLTTLSKDIFAYEKINFDEPEKNKGDYENASGIINRKNEIIGGFYYTFRVFPHLYLNTVIVGPDYRFGGTEEYFAYNIKSKEKTILPFEKIFDTNSFSNHFKSQPLYRTVTESVPGDVDFKMDTYGHDEYVVGKWGVVFPNGQVAIPNQYDYIERISAEYFKFGVGIPLIVENIEEDTLYLKETKWGLIDINNKIILDAEFDWIYMNDQHDFITNKGGIVYWDNGAHSPEWEIDGGVYKEFLPA